ncbi:SDR family NAD(P)-dependent oxidoreductase [Micromonospora sp. KC606]|uniref:SDR family NAD(P)-dependent oxidoreductase n=1 Tax=Micromonospora sp. KC606 TaxID=2530379 RepID=UPI00105089FB|nr:SDR family NAD(P)-dependent oxidoreductase [Micromonospora sp. KC606]TDC76525.1 SDR family NAD(P)-dependent oxidoreductase [Micromonospora sp. KC606]
MIQRYGPWAVITGASSGIGRAFAEHLAAQGLHVVLVARRGDLLRELGRRLSAAHGVSHRVVVTDLSLPTGASAVVDAVTDLDVGLLVSNAGSARPGAFLDTDPAELQRAFTLHASTHMELTRALGPRLVARGRGGIVLTSASGGRHGMPWMAHVGAAKAYVLHLGEALHEELAPAGVRVTVLVPANVDTPIVDAIGLDRKDLPGPLQPPAVAVRRTLRALQADKPVIIPGPVISAMLKAIPRRMSIRMNGRLMAKAARVHAARDAQARRAGSAA